MEQNISKDKKVLLMVVPCYNESKRFDISYWKWIISNSPQVQWIYVNDGSRDETGVLFGALREYGAITLNLEKNSGKAEAVRHGIRISETYNSTYTGVGYVDADMAFDKSEVVQFCNESINLLNSNTFLDCHVASRVKLSGYNISRSSGRHYLSRVITTWFGLLWREIPYDTQCGLKVFNLNSSIRDAIVSPFATRWLFDIELMLRISSVKGRAIVILERPLKYWKEIGESKINRREKFRILQEITSVSKLLFKSRKIMIAPND
jgi:dolichyl-phosphate beta-glucosyltransferase